jgi:hypothetical protein
MDAPGAGPPQNFWARTATGYYQRSINLHALSESSRPYIITIVIFCFISHVSNVHVFHWCLKKRITKFLWLTYIYMYIDLLAGDAVTFTF